MRTILGSIGIFPLSWSMNIGKTTGKILAKFLPRLTNAGKRNLEIAMPELSPKEKENILSGCFESLGRHLGFVSHFKKFKPEDIRNLIGLVGRENFDEAIATGRGILFITGHFGSWEVFNLLPPAFGYSLNILVRRIDNTMVENHVESFRTRFGSRTIDKKTSARTMFRLLKKGEMLGIVADLNSQEREGVFVDFFGVPASTTASVAKLALATNAIILPAFAVWSNMENRYVVHIEKPVEYQKTGDDKQDILDITQRFTSVIEDFVRKFPEQWMWIHKRWNTRPEGEQGIYS